MKIFPDMHLVNDYTSLSNTAQKSIIHQVTTMLATSKKVPFPGHNHLLTASTNGQTLIITLAPAKCDN